MSTITVDHCVQVLRNKFHHDNFSLVEYSVEPSQYFLGFCSSQAKLTITAQVRGKNKTYGFFIKATTEKPELNEKFWSVQRTFLKEHLVRDRLIPDLAKFAVDKITADMYCGDREKFIVLEDLNHLGYELCRTKYPDFEHACLGLKALANLHASSICLQNQTEESLQSKYKSALFETILTFPNGRNSPCLLYSIVTQLRFLANHLDNTIGSETKSKIIDIATDRILEFTQPSKKHLNVMCHGDAWGNNLLYTYDNNNKKPTSAVLVDFQTVRYAPPAIDIVHYLYASFPPTFCSLHLDELIEIYYDRLSDYLLRSNIKIIDILPERAFKESIKDYKEFGVLVRAFYLMTRFPAETLSTLAESQESYLNALTNGCVTVFDHAFNVSEDYKMDAIESLNELFKFYLNKWNQIR